MTRKEAESSWHKRWICEQNDALRGTVDKWYVAGYYCLFKWPDITSMQGNYPLECKEIWLMGNQDARGDWGE